MGRAGGAELGWLAEPSIVALRAALRQVAPEAAEGAIVPRWRAPGEDPRWWAASAVVDGRFVAKFAWAREPAIRLRHEARILEVLRRTAPTLPLPGVVAFCADPAVLVLRRAAAVPFFQVRRRISSQMRDIAAHDIALALAGLHHPDVLSAVTDQTDSLPEPMAPATTSDIGNRLTAWVPPSQWDWLQSCCDWVDVTLATSRQPVLVHGDFHGDNHLWDPEALRLRLLVDFETAGVGEAEFDMRCLPGDLGLELFSETIARYTTLAGTAPNVKRIMAWHMRTVLGDVLWRAEAGVALPDNRTRAHWFSDLHARFAALAIVI